MKIYKTKIIFLFLLAAFNLKLCALKININEIKEKKLETIFSAQIFTNKTKISHVNKYIKRKKTFIINMLLFRDIIKLSNKDKLYKKTIDKIFLKEKSSWNIFATRDKNFAIFIPHKKYPKILSKKDLKGIGLNKDTIFTIKIYNKYALANNIKKLAKASSKTKEDINSFFNIFLSAQILNLI